MTVFCTPIVSFNYIILHFWTTFFQRLITFDYTTKVFFCLLTNISPTVHFKCHRCVYNLFLCFFKPSCQELQRKACGQMVVPDFVSFPVYGSGTLDREFKLRLAIKTLFGEKKRSGNPKLSPGIQLGTLE